MTIKIAASHRIALGIAFACMSFNNAVAQPTANAKTLTSATRDPVLLANDILNRWEPVAVAAGVHTSVWREMFLAQLGAMDVAILGRIDGLKVDTAIDAKVGYAQFAGAFRSALMQSYMAGREGKGHMKLGSLMTDQVFIPITPCRVVDTRNVGGPIVAGTTRAFYFYTADLPQSAWSDQGGVPGASVTSCPGTVLTTIGGTLSAPPSAAMATVTAVNPSAAGNLIVWGGAGSVPQSSALNFAGGQTLANTTVIPSGGRGSGTVLDFAVGYNGPTGQANVVVDVVGFFVENRATALDCISMQSGSVFLSPGSVLVAHSSACPTGYTMVSGGCHFDLAEPPKVEIRSSGPEWTSDDWYCIGKNVSNVFTSLYVDTRCCRLPGR